MKFMNVVFCCFAFLPFVALAQHNTVSASVESEGFAPAKPKQDPHAEFLVYTGRSVYLYDGDVIAGLKFYRFDLKRRTYQQAIDFCKSKGLRLMTVTEASELIHELKADVNNLTDWLSGERDSTVWTSSSIGGLYDGAYNFDVRRDDVSIGQRYTSGEEFVRCVGR